MPAMKFAVKLDNRTTAAKQAAKILGVTIMDATTEVREVYGPHQYFCQVWSTACGKRLVVAADNRKVRASIEDADFDWVESISDQQANYQGMAEAAGIADFQTEAELRKSVGA